MHRGLCILSSIFSSQLFTGGFLGGGVRRGFFFLPLLWESFFFFSFLEGFLELGVFFFFSFVFAVFFFFIGVLRWRGGFSSGRAMVLTFFFFFPLGFSLFLMGFDGGVFFWPLFLCWSDLFY